MVYYSHSLVVAHPGATSKDNPSCKQGCNATIRCFPTEGNSLLVVLDKTWVISKLESACNAHGPALERVAGRVFPENTGG